MSNPLTYERREEALKALVQALGALGLVHKMHGYVPPDKPDAEPVRVPFHTNMDEAYEGFTPEVRETLVKLLDPYEEM